MNPQIWNLVRDALVLLGPTGEIFDCNHAFCGAVERDRTALVGQLLSDFFLLDQGAAGSVLVGSSDRAARSTWIVHELEMSPRRSGYRLLRIDRADPSAEAPEPLLPAHTGPGLSGAAGRVADRLPLDVWVTDHEGRLLYWNNHIRRAFAAPEGGAAVHWAWEMFAEGEKDKFLTLLQKAAAAPRPVRDELRLAGGAWAIVSMSGHPAGDRLSPGEDHPLIYGTSTDISRQKQMESYLFASEERFALAVSGSLDGIWDWNIEASNLYCSRRFCELLGYEPAEFRRVKARLFELIYPKDKRAVLIALANHLRHRGSFDVEFRVLHRSGAIRWFRSRGQAIWNNLDGRPSRMAGSLSDINENKVLRSELQSRVDSIQRGSLSLDLDPNGTVRHANSRFLELIGAAPEDVLGRPLADLMTEGAGEPGRLWQTAGASGEFSFRGENGETVSVRGAISPMFDVDGQVYRMHFFGLDETEKKRAVEALAAETAFRRAVLDSAPSFVVTTGKDGVITMVNHYTLQRLGLTEDELIGQKTPAFLFEWNLLEQDSSPSAGSAENADGGGTEAPEFPKPREPMATHAPGPRKSLFAQLVECVKESKTRTFEALFRGADHETCPVLMSVSAVADEHLSLIGYVIVAQDISELKRVQQLKADFVSTVSHELRTPLTSINGALKLVEMGVGGQMPTKARELVEVASRNSQKLILLINDLLDMQKIESGQLTFAMAAFDPLDLISQGVESIRTYAADKQIEFRVQVSESAIPVWGDAHRVGQVLSNLLSNAVKFSPPGGVVEVALVQGEGSSCVTVSDQGPGIPVAFRGRIFDKFSQADSSDARQKGGTGLGLSIARAIVERHGGEISFSCPQEGGTRFSFTLKSQASGGAPADLNGPQKPSECPEVVSEDRTAETTDQGLGRLGVASSPPSGSPAGQKPLHEHRVSPDPTFKEAAVSEPRAVDRVLVVEDDPDMAGLLEHLVARMGLVAETASTVSQARMRIQAQRFSIITIDVVMREGRGTDLLADIAALKEPLPKVVVITGRAAPESDGRQPRERLQVHKWMRKPITEEQFFQVVQDILDECGQQSLLRAQ